MKLVNLNNPYLTTRILILSFLILSFSVLTGFVMHEGIKSFELAVYSALSQFTRPTMTDIMVFITNLGSTVAIVLLNIVIIALPLTRRVFGLSVAVNSIISAILNSVLKRIFARKRPNVKRFVIESGFGFPSGHTMNSTALYTIILLAVFKQTNSSIIRILVLMISVIAPFSIGISRIYLGVHQAGDVIGGWIMGVTVAILVDTIFSVVKLSYVK